MEIAVGSISAYKLDAVHQACLILGLDVDVTGVETSSGQNEQPIGLLETLKGAYARAAHARQQVGSKDTLSIGIESGVIMFGQPGWASCIDLAVVVALDGERKIVTTSGGIEVPQDSLMIASGRGFETTTVGSVIAEKLGGDASDPHSVLTKGRVSRKDTLVQALVMALSQL